jgi:hypothetical protein
MLFRETVAVYCENHTEHKNTPFGQNSEFWYVNVSGTCVVTTGLYRGKHYAMKTYRGVEVYFHHYWLLH